MPHNNRIRLPGTWTPLSVVMPAEFEQIDERLYESLNADLGGTWAPAAQILLGGAGLWVTGPSQFDDAEVTITAGKSLVVKSGAFVTFELGSHSFLNGVLALANTLTVQPGVSALGSIVFQGAAGNVVKLRMRSYSSLETDGNCLIDFKSATTLFLRDGAVFTVEGNLLGTAPLQFSSGGWSLWNTGTAAVFGSNSTLNLLSGATMNLTSGATGTVQTGAQLRVEAASGLTPGLWAKPLSVVLFAGATNFTDQVFLGDGTIPTTVFASPGVSIGITGSGPLPSSMLFGSNTSWTFGGTLAWVKTGGLKVGEEGVGAGAIDLQVTDNSRFLQRGHHKREGDNATLEVRVVTGSLNNDTFDPSDADVWIVPNLASNPTWTWTTPKKPSTWKVVSYWPGNPQTLNIAGIVTTTIILNSSTYEAITFTYDGSSIYRTGWELVL